MHGVDDGRAQEACLLAESTGSKNHKEDDAEGRDKTLVATRHARERRARSAARRIAASLKRSAERSSRRKSGAYRSALSMLTFYINRAGKNLPKTQRNRLERAKAELKHEFGRE